MGNALNYYLFLLFMFASIFLIVKQFVGEREEAFLRLPDEEQAGLANIKTRQPQIAQIVGKRVLKFMEPIANKLLPFIKQEGLKKRLIYAGAPMSLLGFISFKLLAVSFALILSSIIFHGKMDFIMVAGVVAFLYPDLWLRKKIKRRRYEISRDLPNVIDLLQLCVNGGLDFMLAVNRVIKDFKPCPLREELAEMWREGQMGRSRKETLQNLALRVNSPDIASFVRILIQTDRMGAPMGEALEIHAEELRVRRFQRGEAQAFKAPIKLLFPLIVFIMPVVLIVVGGPIMLQFMHGGGGF